MKRSIFLILSVIVAGFSVQAQGFDESSTSFFSKKQNFDDQGTEIYATNWQLKKYKKVGAGVVMGGVTGAFGITSEINLDPSMALVLGLGTGPSYGTFNIQGKYNLEGYYLNSYFKGGYSKWYSAGKAPSSAGSSDVLSQVYSKRDLSNGNFAPNFLVGGIGVEYNQLEGELSGLNFFGEVSALFELEKQKWIPTGSLGLVYFY